MSNQIDTHDWTYLDNISIDEIKSKATALHNLNLETTPFDEVNKAAVKFLRGHLEWASAYHIDDLYRGRKWEKNDDPPAHASQLLALKPEKVTGFGRLNVPGQSLLYTSELPQTVFNECLVKPGDEIMVIRLRRIPTSPSLYISRFAELPMTTDLDKAGKSEKEIRDMVGSDENYAKLIEMRKQISFFFKEKITEDRNYAYKITAALAEKHTGPGPLHGIMYPSVVTQFVTFNLGLKPDIVGTHFVPHSVAWFRIRKIDWNMHHVFTKHTARITKNGFLVWDDSLSFDAPCPEGMEFKETN